MGKGQKSVAMGGEEGVLRKGQRDSLVILTSPGPSGHPDSEVALLWQLAEVQKGKQPVTVKRGTLHPAVACLRAVQAPEVRKEAQEKGAEVESGRLRTTGHWVCPDSEGRLSSAARQRQMA